MRAMVAWRACAAVIRRRSAALWGWLLMMRYARNDIIGPAIANFQIESKGEVHDKGPGCRFTRLNVCVCGGCSGRPTLSGAASQFAYDILHPGSALGHRDRKRVV